MWGELRGSCQRLGLVTGCLARLRISGCCHMSGDRSQINEALPQGLGRLSGGQSSHCVPRGSGGLAMRAEIPVLTVHTSVGSDLSLCFPGSPWTTRRWTPRARGRSSSSNEEKGQGTVGQQSRGERGRYPGCGCRITALSHPFTSSSRPAPPLRCSFPRCFWRLTLATAVRNRWAARRGLGEVLHLAGQKVLC